MGVNRQFQAKRAKYKNRNISQNINKITFISANSRHSHPRAVRGSVSRNADRQRNGILRICTPLNASATCRENSHIGRGGTRSHNINNERRSDVRTAGLDQTTYTISHRQPTQLCRTRSSSLLQSLQLVTCSSRQTTSTWLAL